MKNALFSLIFSIFALSAWGQKIAWVDSKYILGKIPEYNQAQDQLNALSVQWQGEVEALLSEVDAMRKALEAERILLTEEMQKDREAGIATKEKEARDLQRKYFGPEGDLFKKRAELVKPIQDQLFNAVQDIALAKKYDAIFDKSGAVSMLYAGERYDLSDDVLKKLGY
jgi:outer membrane protein